MDAGVGIGARARSLHHGAQLVAVRPPLTRFRPSWLCELAGARLAVVGADGFIGSHVLRLALSAGASVAAVCLQQPWRISDLIGDGVEPISVDQEALGRRGGLSPVLGVDAVAWLAYVAPSTGADALRFERELNVEAARRAAELGIPVVFASSADVYGPVQVRPVSEDGDPDPRTPYAIAKLEAERVLENAGTILRIATVYGPGENGPRAIPSFVRALVGGRSASIDGDGSDIRDYVHVSDVAGAFVNAAASAAPGILNIGSGRGRTTLEILEAVARALEVEPRREHRVPSRQPSRLVLAVERARRVLGFAPRTEIGDHLAEETEWLKAFLRGGCRATPVADGHDVSA